MSKCFYCGGAMLRRGKQSASGKRLSRTDDHKTPLSRGGPDGPENIVTCHARCNVDKGDRTLEEYRAVVARKKGVDPKQFKFPGEQL